MIGSLHGTVAAHLDQRTLIEVQGVGYWVHTGSWHPQGELTCYIHHVVREEVSDLYGFERLVDLQLFEKLLSISGIGPKAALALLSIGTPEKIQQAILAKDITFLSTAPGIGQKAASKIVLELHNKLDGLTGLLEESSEGSADLLSALVGLGYKPHEVRPLLGKIPENLTTVDAKLKWALQNL